MVEDVVELLSELVRIPSVCGNESPLADYIADWLQEHNLSVDRLEVKPNRPNVITTLRGRGRGPRVLLNGHMDTVEAGDGWTMDPFGAEVKGGRMFGRGTYDMKAGLASILWAAASCKEEGLPKRGELIVTAVVDEEAFDLGTYALIQKGITKNVDLAMIPEPTDHTIITAHRGRIVFDVEVRGRTAHSEWPTHGVNAVEKAALLVNALDQIGGPRHERMGLSTVNVLKIEGGQENLMLVPDRCRLVIDRCLVPGYSQEAALTDLRNLIAKIGIDAQARLVTRETPFCQAFELPDDFQYIRPVAQAAARVLGASPATDYHLGPCDSCILVSEGGVPTLEFGPQGGRLHESDEYVEVDSVRKTAAVYYEILRDLLS